MNDEPIHVSIKRTVRDSGPMHDTHHWHLEIFVGARLITSSWCYPRGIAVYTAVEFMEQEVGL